MRFYLIIITLVVGLLLNASCHAQQIMLTVNNANKLIQKKDLFIGKPLKNLLKEINPAIKRVIAEPNSAERLGYFIFNFVSRQQYDSTKAKNLRPLGITVFVKETFKWEENGKPLIIKSSWTKDDLIKYGDLTVVDIRVSGKN